MKMYDNLIEAGCYEESNYSVSEIVDNDIVNYCSVITEDEKEFESVLKTYKDGEFETDDGYYYIEAVDNEEKPTMFLVRCC